ncbi:MAG: hypothetical protein JJU34_18405 [Lunatimonas sp.]|nr:hypothetical protein [Lunatimonas sp.]
MKLNVSLMLFLCTFFYCQAQHYDTKLFDKRLVSMKNKVSESIRKYNHIQKEYRQYIKDRKKEFRQKKDSVNSESLGDLERGFSKDSLRQLVRSQQEYFVYTDSLYSLREIAGWNLTQIETKKRTVSHVKNDCNSREYFLSYLGLKRELSSYRSTLRIYRDSLRSLDTLGRNEIRFLVSRRKKELTVEYENSWEEITRDFVNDEIPPLTRGFQSKELLDFQQANRYLKKGAVKDGMSNLSRVQTIDHFKEKQELLKIAADEMAELKKKFSEVADSQDLSSAKKSNSLKGKPIKRRIVYGSNFQLHVVGQTKIDFNPELGYRLNSTSEVGLGGTYRFFGNRDDPSLTINKPMVMGFRGYIERKLTNNLYVHGEFESLKSTMNKTGEVRESLWYNSLLAGLERRFVMTGRLQGQAQVLYNFNSQNNPLYNSPWVFRVGFSFSETNK